MYHHLADFCLAGPECERSQEQAEEYALEMIAKIYWSPPAVPVSTPSALQSWMCQLYKIGIFGCFAIVLAVFVYFVQV